MPGKHLFEYAVIRVVPRVEREEFLNVGVVLYCSSKKFLQARYLVDENRLKTFSPKLDTEEIKEYLCAFERICTAAPGSGPIGKLGIAERFRWLTATRSTVVQSSRVHPGLAEDPTEMLDRLYNEMVTIS